MAHCAGHTGEVNDRLDSSAVAEEHGAAEIIGATGVQPDHVGRPISLFFDLAKSTDQFARIGAKCGRARGLGASLPNLPNNPVSCSAQERDNLCQTFPVEAFGERQAIVDLFLKRFQLHERRSRNLGRGRSWQFGGLLFSGLPAALSSNDALHV